MFHRSAQAPCRLSTRRRLALGGLVLTGALTAGAFVSTPAYADGPTPVANVNDLQTALSNHDASIQLTQSIDASSNWTFQEFEVPTTLDLHGFDLAVSGLSVAANASVTVDDTTATADEGSDSHLTATPPAFGALPAIALDDHATLRVTDVDVSVSGTQGGAGITGTPTSSFIADGTARVAAYGSDDTTHGGGAGIGGGSGEPGFHVTVAGNAGVRAYGGKGAAGVGGGFGAAGGDVHVSGGALQAQPGAAVDPTAVRASAIGAGENATALGFGGLQIDDGASVSLDSSTPLVLPSDAVVHNAGEIVMNPGQVETGHVLQGTGTVDNTGRITAHGENGDAIDPDQLIDSTVKVTGSNYRVTVDPNGGTISGADATSRHIMSSSLGDLLGYSYSVDAPSGPAYFQGWNTKADGTGTDVADRETSNLSVLGASTDGTPVSVALYAKFVTDPTPAPEPEGPVLVDPIRSTVKIGHKVRLVLGAADTTSATYRVVSGSLPKGVVLDRTTGVISGTPSTAGSWFVEVEATNDGGSASTTVLITVPMVKDLLDARGHVPAVALGAAKVPLKIAGFKKGEHFTVTVDGKVVRRGVMKKAGTLSIKVSLKKALRDKSHTITISGSRKVTDRSTRAATTVIVTSLAAKKTFKVKSVAGYDGRKYVVIERLGAGEKVVVKDGAKVIASGVAAEDGSFVFPQAKAGKGTSKLTVHGASAKRTGKLTVKNAKR